MAEEPNGDGTAAVAAVVVPLREALSALERHQRMREGTQKMVNSPEMFLMPGTIDGRYQVQMWLLNEAQAHATVSVAQSVERIAAALERIAAAMDRR